MNKPKRKPQYQPRYQLLIPMREIRYSGVSTRDVYEMSLARLKREVETAIDRNFWGNPDKPYRPKTDPMAGGFTNLWFKNGKRT